MQMEESYLLSDSSGRNNLGGFTTTEENEYIFTTNDDNGGLDALDGVPGDSLVDLTNSLSETSSSSSTTSKTTPLPPRPGLVEKNPTRTIEGHYGNRNDNDALLPTNNNNLATARPPPHEEDNSSTSRSRSNREGLAVQDASNFKDTLPASSTPSAAAVSTVNGDNNNEDDLERNDRPSQNIPQKQSLQPSKPISKLRDKDRAEVSTSSSSANNNKATQDMSMTSFNHHDVLQADAPAHADDAADNNHRRHDQILKMDKLNKQNNGEEDSRRDVKPLSQEMFKPIHPIISSERDESMSFLNNHKMPISFDRVSPEYYDNQPWTPLLDRPNLDKRPRVEIDEKGALSSTEPIIVWNSEEPEESVEFPHRNFGNFTVSPGMDDVVYGHGANFTVGTYYGYGHTGVQGQAPPPHSSTEEIGDVVQGVSHPHLPQQPPYPVEHATFNETLTVGDGGPILNAEVVNGFKPSNIPAYTILIPHIPNPLNGTNDTFTGADSSGEAEEETLSPSGPTDDYSNMYKMDRMGVVDDGVDNDEEVKHEDQKNTKPVVQNKEKIHYNFEAIKTIPVPEETMKDDDYMDSDLDEFTEGVQGEPKIYRLDVDNVDVVPDTLGNAKPPQTSPSTTSTTSNIPKTEGTERSQLEDEETYDDDSFEQKQNEVGVKNATVNSNASGKNKTKDFDKEFSPASMELVIGPQEPDLLIKSTTDLIMSTLGSLNLIKTPTKELTQEEIEEKLRNSDIAPKPPVANKNKNNTRDSPLFPPVRSYVGINQPLRPKPNPNEPGTSTKQFRYSDGTTVDVTLPNFPPDLATTASLQKVLSMMLGQDGALNEQSRHLASHPLIKGLLNKQNVTLVSNDTGKETVLNLENILPTVIPTMRQTPTTPKDGIIMTSTLPVTTSHRDPKAFGSHRDSKIDTAQFTTAGDVQHVPVPLIITESPMQADQPPLPSSDPLHLTAFPWSSKPPKASTKVLNNSPVYKFVLKKGQSVEDLLKEIFLNYSDNETTHGGHFRDSSAETQKVPSKLGILSSGVPGFKSLEDMNVEQTTKTSSATTPIRISHHVETTPFAQNPVPLPTMMTSQESSAEVQTSTSIVINEVEMDLGFDCPINETFRCVSNGKCIPSYLRCNFIKECEDNSDEEGCLCADFLRANGNSRKLCDGIPDCSDASDEYQDCEYCQPGQYICAGTRSCINKTQICDSKRDCQYGDDESDCVKIGHAEIATLKEDFSPTYHQQGHLMVRKTGNWGKLCVESFSSVVSHWEVKDLARAVCKALTFSDYKTVEQVQDPTANSSEPYYELHYGSNNQSVSSGEAHQRPGLGFRQTECKSKQVVNVTCQDLQCGVAPRAYTQRARYRVTRLINFTIISTAFHIKTLLNSFKKRVKCVDIFFGMFHFIIRIVGGANSLPGKWPWQAALYKNGEYQCGATLISSRWLLSAGHCFYHAQDDHWVARLGTLRRGATVLSPYEQVIRITHIFLHPEYKDVGFINDVSLLRLEKEVNFTDYVRPVCLPGKESKIRDGRMCTVVGWGQLFEVGRVFPDTLQEVQLPLISTGECRKRTLFLPLYKLTEQMFCAGFDRGGRDACLGDSGGPLMCPESDGRWSLYGVTSNGYGCARANRPGVYTKVTSYLDWIYDKMSQDSAFTYRDKSKPCPGHRCLLGECLDKRQVCNGIRDCIEDDGSDERGPNCTTSAYLA
ncbi:Enteropeptidase [Orchesella cincta]|uniref:Enteropeptidase n=1 Tax=Orchesella cincta TaxID=48709 RepID=A0A1D2N774_ORCCI|nr:Enteropeptidase [Orchesella cincta]